MLRTFTNLVNETVNEAYENGINLFLESLENDLEKDLYIENHGIEGALQEAFEGTTTDEAVTAIEETEEITNIE